MFENIIKNITTINVKEILDSSIMISISITIITYSICNYFYKLTKITLLNPLLISVIILGLFLYFTKIPYETYNKGGEFITALLSPATVALALPIYRKRGILMANYKVIIISIIVGIISAFICTFIIAKMLRVNDIMLASMLLKSITTPIAVELSDRIGGLRSIVIFGIMLSSFTGALLGPFICRIFRIKSKIAKGLAMGASSQSLGFTKALEMGETEGAMASLAVVVSAIITVGLLPILLQFALFIFNKFFMNI